MRHPIARRHNTSPPARISATNLCCNTTSAIKLRCAKIMKRVDGARMVPIARCVPAPVMLSGILSILPFVSSSMKPLPDFSSTFFSLPTESKNSSPQSYLRTTKQGPVEDTGSTGFVSMVTNVCLGTGNEDRTAPFTSYRPTRNTSFVQKSIRLWTILRTWCATCWRWNYDKVKHKNNLIPLLTPISSFDNLKILIE